MSWVWVVVSGLLEIGWAVSLQKTQGFTRFLPMLSYAAFGLAAAYFLSKGMAGLPLAVAYALRQGIAMIGTTLYEAYFMISPTDAITLGMASIEVQKAAFNWYRLAGIIFIVLGIACLKFSTPAKVGI